MDNNIVYLYNCYELDINHEHTVNFNSKQSQLKWFNSRGIYYMEDCKHLKRGQTVIIPKYINDSRLQLCNYCMFKNDEGKEEYYFILDKEYMNEYNTKLYLKLDVFQTFYFDVTFDKFTSLVERCHLKMYDDNGLPYIENMYEDEGLEIGEYEIKNKTTIYDYYNKGSYIVTSSNPLSSSNGGGETSGSGTSDNWKKGLVSENGFVLIKSMEGFSSTPYNLGDGTYTIGYGTTSEYDSEHYNQLAPECTEEQASNVFADSLDNKYASYVLKILKSSGKDLSTVKQCHFDAFVSFYYNHGSLTDHDIWVMYVNGDSEESIAERWKTTVIMEGSAFESGLRDRRNRESQAFLGTYNPKQIENLNGGYVTDNNGKGYIPSRYIIQEFISSDLRKAIVNSAKSLIGKPYIWGGNYPPLGSDNGTDCSGLCQWSYSQNGIKISRTTYTQIEEGKLISQSQAREGDLIFTDGYGSNGHVVMFLYNNDDGSFHCVEAKGKDYGILETDRQVTSNTMFRNLIGD